MDMIKRLGVGALIGLIALTTACAESEVEHRGDGGADGAAHKRGRQSLDGRADGEELGRNAEESKAPAVDQDAEVSTVSNGVGLANDQDEMAPPPMPPRGTIGRDVGKSVEDIMAASPCAPDQSLRQIVNDAEADAFNQGLRGPQMKQHLDQALAAHIGALQADQQKVGSCLQSKKSEMKTYGQAIGKLLKQCVGKPTDAEVETLKKVTPAPGQQLQGPPMLSAVDHANLKSFTERNLALESGAECQAAIVEAQRFARE